MATARASSFRIAVRSARRAATLVPRALAAAWPALVALHASELAVSQFIGAAQNAELKRGEADLVGFALLALWQVAVATIWSSAYLAVVGGAIDAIDAGRAPERPLPRLARIWNQTLIETVRVWAATVRWALALVLPAAYAYGRLAWAPFVAALDDDYDAGAVDALDRSWSATKGRWALSAAVAFAAAAAPDLAAVLAHGSDDRLLVNPLGTLGGAVASAAVGLCATCWSVCVFRELSPRGSPASPPDSWTKPNVLNEGSDGQVAQA